MERRLEHLCHLHRYSAVRVERLRFDVELKTPKQLAQAEEEQTKWVLPEVATNMRRMASSPVFEVESYLENLADCLVGNVRRSLLLVGPSGVGKTAIVHELVRRRGDLGLLITDVLDDQRGSARGRDGRVLDVARPLSSRVPRGGEDELGRAPWQSDGAVARGQVLRRRPGRGRFSPAIHRSR